MLKWIARGDLLHRTVPSLPSSNQDTDPDWLLHAAPCQPGNVPLELRPVARLAELSMDACLRRQAKPLHQGAVKISLGEILMTLLCHLARRCHSAASHPFGITSFGGVGVRVVVVVVVVVVAAHPRRGCNADGAGRRRRRRRFARRRRCVGWRSVLACLLTD